MRRHTAAITAVLLAATSAAGSRGQDLFTDADRFYLAPIVGASWSSLVDDEYEPLYDRSLFTAGGAGGIALDRASGQVRLEFEGRYRDSFLIAEQQGPVEANLEVVDNWSAMVNGWRDFSITERLGVYGGGGIGAGGYGLSITAAISGTPPLLQGGDRHTEFAWQVGTGLLYALSDRITLDLGYRFYSVGLGTTTFNTNIPGVSFTESTGFASNELLLSLRIYEPFRGWP